MVMDEYGTGKCVQHSLLESNGDWHMHRAIEHFKRANDGRWKLLRAIVVDKDMNEIKVLQSHFPEAEILLCSFHVIKYLRGMMKKSELGVCSEGDRVILETVVRGMMNALTEEVYEDKRVALNDLCSRINMSGFAEYMDKNWHTCKKMWVRCYRQKLPHFKNETNNRLESFFGKLKGSVSGSSTMSETVRALAAEGRRVEKEYAFARRPGG
jgi:hypothetical protein